MTKPVFDITSFDQASTEWRQCRLVIEMNQQYFYYVVLYGENSVVALKYYEFSPRSITEAIAFAEEIIREDQLLREAMKEYIVIYNWPENCLVPENHFNMDVSEELLKLLHGDINKGIIHSEKIHSWNTYNVYRIPLQMQEFFQRHFPNGKYWHYYTLFLESLVDDIRSQKSKAILLFYPNKVIVAVFVEGLLQLIQSLEYQTSDDVVYHMLNIYQRLKLSPEEVILQVSGMIDQNSGVYQELRKYFLLVKTGTLPDGLQVSEDFKSFPEHYFSPLLKVALCVS